MEVPVMTRSLGRSASVCFWVAFVVVSAGCGKSLQSEPAATKEKGGSPQTSAPKAPPPEEMPKAVAVDLGGGVKLEMVLIPAGEFMMGWSDSDGNAFRDAQPRHRVRISKPFYLGKHEVTQEQWQAIVGENPSNVKGPKNPVENVSWDDCQVFLRRLNEKVGGGKFGLPTEAQWEYACRAGSTTRWCFGNSDSALGEYAWCEENSDGTTHPVGQKKPNAWGLYDMHGNVWEWCQDWFDSGYYGKSPVDDPPGPAAGSGRVHRGGGWPVAQASG
jgi:formylglycine-generating enzyme required for sulfatase activity